MTEPSVESRAETPAEAPRYFTARVTGVLTVLEALFGVASGVYGFVQPNTTNATVAFTATVLALGVGVPITVAVVVLLERRRATPGRKRVVVVLLVGLVLFVVAGSAGVVIGRRVFFHTVGGLVTIDALTKSDRIPAPGPDGLVTLTIRYTIHDTSGGLCDRHHLWLIDGVPAGRDNQELFTAVTELRCVKGTATFTRQFHDYPHHQLFVARFNDADHRSWAVANQQFQLANDASADGYWTRVPPSTEYPSNRVVLYRA